MIPFSDEDLLQPVKNAIEKIRPSIKLDGGDVELLAIRDARVFIQLKGACVGCASSGTTLKYGIENKLKALIHPDLVVINVPFGKESDLESLL
ncbi:MAG: NifU family protein [Sulfuricurvum sp.]|jgi:Fe-S cluster biogenesis protein NfuA